MLLVATASLIAHEFGRSAAESPLAGPVCGVQLWSRYDQIH